MNRSDAMKPLAALVVVSALVLWPAPAPAQRPREGDVPTLRLKSMSQSKGARPTHLLVFEGDGAGQIHRAGPEHFKLTRVSDDEAVSLAVEYDRETLDQQDRLVRQGTPRNLEQVIPALKVKYKFNHLFQGVRLLLDNGRHDAKDAIAEGNSLYLYGRAKLEVGERYRLTWACWPVGAVKATELSVEFELSKADEKTPAEPPDPDAAEPPATLAGSWLMTLPRGAMHKVALRPAGEKKFRLETATRFAGVYELRDDRLVMVEPTDAAEKGFDWELRESGELVLVTQRPGLEQDYLGTTLSRWKDGDADKLPKRAGEPKALPPKRYAPVEKVAASWDSAAIDGAFMFRDADEFQSYVAQAETIALGTLSDWDGTKGTLKVEKVYRASGKPESLSVSYNGGTVAAKAGDKVLALLAAKKDAKLHAYCAASGLFRFSPALEAHVERALLRPAPAEDGLSAEETKAAEALRGIKSGYRLRKEPKYAASAQYCLLLLGREAKTKVWLASDGVTMYVDRNGNGDLTEPDEAIPYKNGFAALMSDAFPGHGGDAEHTSLHIAVRQRDWEKNTGGYWAVRADVGHTFHMYAMVHKFARKPQDAPIVHLGGPLRMGLNHLYGGALIRGGETELEAYAACHYPGVERAFVDVDRRCPKDVHPIAEVRLPGGSAAEPLTLRVPLTQRC
jgi:hypothetical protein